MLGEDEEDIGLWGWMGLIGAVETVVDEKYTP
jgi:hypothetical protein